MVMKIQPVVRKFVEDNFAFRVQQGTLTDDASFLELSLIDSTGLLELIFFLEKQFQIRVGDDEMVPENLDSIARISDYVSRKLNGRATKISSEAAYAN